MPQIQYPGLTNPPAFTKPTPSTGQMDWYLQRPDWGHYGAGRGRTPAGRLPTHLQTTGATVFAVEQWPLPNAPSKAAAAYYPDSPQQFIRRTDSRARGGGYENTQWATWDLSPEPFPLTNVLTPKAYGPDMTARAALKTANQPVLFPDPSAPAVSVTGTDWMKAYPDQTSRPALKPANQPSTTNVFAPESFPAVLGWGVELPDDPVLRRKSFGWMPSWVTDPTTPPVQFSTVDWMNPRPTNPNRVLPRQSANVNVFAVEQFPLPKPWLPTAFYPDTTRRRALTTAELPALFDVNPPAAFMLLWSMIYPDRTWRRKLDAAELAIQVTVQPVGSVLLQCEITYPDTTRRRSLPVYEMPAWISDTKTPPGAATRMDWIGCKPDMRVPYKPWWAAHLMPSFFALTLNHPGLMERDVDLGSRAGSRTAGPVVQSF